MPDSHDPRLGRVGSEAVRQRARIRLMSVALGLAVLLGAVAVSTSAARKDPQARGATAAKPTLAAAVAENRREQRRLTRFRRSARERRARRRSRGAYRKLGRRQSIKLARARFDTMAEPLWKPPELPDAARRERYIGDHAMVIDLPGEDKALVESLLPLVAADEGGDKGPIDLALTSGGGAFEPKNALVKSRLPKKLGDAVTLEGGISVAIEGDDVAGQLVDGKVYYGDALPATDIAIAPLPTGVETFAQLRSSESPEAYVLKFDLPPGAHLGAKKGRPIEIVDGQDVVGTISPPITVDADGLPVPTSYDVVGRKLVIQVDHRGRDLKYPLLLDPVIESFRWHCPTLPNGQDQSGYDCVGAPDTSQADTDRWYFDLSDSRFSYGFNDHNGYGLDLYMAAAFSPNGYAAFANGSWNWKPPGAAYIYRAEFGLFRFSGGSNVHVAQGIAQPSGAWEDGPRGAYWVGPDLPGGTSPYIRSNAAEDWRWRTHCVRPGCEWNRSDIPGPNTYRVVLFSGGADSSSGWAHLGAAYMYLHDRDAPSWTDTGASPSPNWAKNHSGDFHLGATDPSLGMKKFEVEWPGWIEKREDPCAGANPHPVTADQPRWGRCDGPYVQQFFYDTSADPSRWSEGVHQVRVHAADVVGNYASSDNTTKTFRIDRTAPEYNADSGPLREGNTNWITDPSPSLTVDIRDPSPNGGEVSGVKHSKIEFNPGSGLSDTKENDKADGSAGPCGAESGCRSTLNQPHTLTWDDPPDGTHTVRVSSEDAAGNPKPRTWTVTFERAGPRIDSLSGALSVNHKWVRPGSTYSLTADTSDSASGVKEIRLKVNGRQVDSATGDPRPGTSACDSAGCHRDPAPKTLSWTVPESYDDPPATIEVVAVDAAGNASDASRTIRVDRNPPFPEPDFGGSLWEARGKAVRGTAFELFMRGKDGDDELQSSGVQQMFLDTRPPGGTFTEHGRSPTQGCSYSSCEQEHTFQFSPTSTDAGRTPRRFVPRVKDQVGFESPFEPFDVLFDNSAPTLDEPVHEQPVDRWYGSQESLRTTLTAHDAGSGVKAVTLFTPNGSGGEDSQTRDDASCSDALTSLCPTDPPATVFSYSTSGIPHGANNTVRAVVRDAVTSESAVRTWPVKVDGAIPSRVDLSGELPDDPNRVVGKHTHGMTISAEDGFSGVDTLRYEVTPLNEPNNVVDQDSLSNDACTASGCPPTFAHDFTVDTSALAAGDYVLTAFGEDQVGLTREAELQFRVDPNILSAQQALSQIRGTFPDVVAASTSVDVEGESLSPSIPAEPADGVFQTSGTLATSTIASNYGSGFSVGEDLATVAVTPSDAGVDATKPLVAEGSAAVYANGQYATDVVVRPTGNGIETFMQIRSGAAPATMSWEVALRPNQELRTLSNGSVAVVEETPLLRTETIQADPAADSDPDDGFEAEDVGDDPANLDQADIEPETLGDEPLDVNNATLTLADATDVPVTELVEGPGANDTASQMNRETRAHADAQEEVTDSATVRAVFLPPTARDADGATVPTTMTASGSVITVAVLHQAGVFAYPIMVDPETSAGADDGGEGEEIEAARHKSFKVLTWNIQGNKDVNGDGKGDPMRKPFGGMAGLIKSQKTPIVLLQEVCATVRPGQAPGGGLERLRQELSTRHRPMSAYWVPERVKAGSKALHPCGGGQREGVAILVRPHHRMGDRSHYVFSKAGHEKDFRRVLIGATLTIGGHELRTYNTHLAFRNKSWTARQISIVGEIAARHGASTVIGADWNLNPWNKAFKNRDSERRGLEGRGFDLIGPGPSACGHTLVGAPGVCIDHVWGDRANVGPVGSEPADIITEMAPQDSDHFPVKVRIGYRTG